MQLENNFGGFSGFQLVHLVFEASLCIMPRCQLSIYRTVGPLGHYLSNVSSMFD